MVILRRKNADKRNFIFGTPILQSGERDRIFILFSPPLIESVRIHFRSADSITVLFLRHSHKNDDDDDDDDDDDGRLYVTLRTSSNKQFLILQAII